ncbi:LWamide neuropeptides-like isoform X2 [Rhopilema esculentum]|eukprot:gene15425-6666_t
MRLITLGIVVLLSMSNCLLTTAEDSNDASLEPVPPGPRSLFTKEGDDFEEDENDFLEHERRENQPPGVWGKRENQPPGVWGKRSNQPPGVWGKRVSKEENQPPGVWRKKENQPPGVWRKKENQPPGVWRRDNNQPPGVWRKKESQPPGVWRKRENQPPGVWGKRSNKKHEENFSGVIDGRAMKEIEKDARGLNERKIALIRTVKRLREALAKEYK